MWDGKMKFYLNDPYQMTKVATMPIYVKTKSHHPHIYMIKNNLKSLLLQNYWPYCLETESFTAKSNGYLGF